MSISSGFIDKRVEFTRIHWRIKNKKNSTPLETRPEAYGIGFQIILGFLGRRPFPMNEFWAVNSFFNLKHSKNWLVGILLAKFTKIN